MSPRELVFLLLVCALACKNKQEEPALQTRSDQPHELSTDGAPRKADSLKQTLPSNSSEQKKNRVKPAPPLPIEQMTRLQLSDYKKLLKVSGFYSCCTEPDCRMCVLEDEECFCEEHVKKKRPVCSECYEGWQAGKGRIKGVRAEDVTKQ